MCVHLVCPVRNFFKGKLRKLREIADRQEGRTTVHSATKLRSETLKVAFVEYLCLGAFGDTTFFVCGYLHCKRARIKKHDSYIRSARHSR